MRYPSCEFCIEILEPENSYFYKLFSKYGFQSRIIKDDQGFIAIAGLGALTEGYILLLPKEHYISLSYLPLQELVLLEKFKSKIEQLINKEYPNLIAFEHGAASNKRLGAACLDHAHLHICQCPVDLSHQIDNRFPVKTRVKNLLKLSEFRGQPYLYYENQNGEKYIYCIPDQIESQYMRRLWAKSLNMADMWDWGTFIGEDDIINTLKRLNTQEKLLRR